jgi:2-phosphosulfolactate phosphatase
MIYYTLAGVMKLDVVVAPTFLDREELDGCVCAVIDVLRATTTIITALESGSIGVRPCMDIAEAKRSAAERNRGSSLLGGEEKGRQIPGFDLGNSPLEYLDTPTVAGKVIFFYTTNGSGAIRRAYEECGQPVHIAALLNMSAASSALVNSACESKARGIVILCSGRYGKPSAEDLFCAGLIVEKASRELRELGNTPRPGDVASVAMGFASVNKEQSYDIVATSEHGRFLESIGFAADLAYCSRVDTHDVVPIFEGRMVVLPSSTLQAAPQNVA